MIVYLSTYQNESFIKETLSRLNNVMVEGQNETRKDIGKYLKGLSNRIKSIDTIIIDLAAFNMDDTKYVLEMLKSSIVTYEDTQIIVFDFERQPGDLLLSQIYDIGIYDIITSRNVGELFKCITVGKSAGDAETYKIKEEEKRWFWQRKDKNVDRKAMEEGIDKATALQNCHATLTPIPPVGETVDSKSEAHDSESKEQPYPLKLKKKCITIGFCGSMNRIGTTFSMITFAAAFKDYGLNIAVTEAAARVFPYIKDSYTGIKEEKGFFQYKDIDFIEMGMPEDIDSYDCILTDYGTDVENKDFVSSDVKVLVSGSKAWEFEEFGNCFNCNKDFISRCNHIFSFTSKENEINIKNTLSLINPKVKMYCPGYIEDMFHPDKEEMKKMILFALKEWKVEENGTVG